MLSVWDRMDGWKITEILYAALSWELSKQMWFLAQRDMILAELHPKIHGEWLASPACQPLLFSGVFSKRFIPCSAGSLGTGTSTRDHQAVEIRILPVPTLGKSRSPVLTSLWFLSQSFWASEPSSACQSLYINLFFLRANSTSLPTAMLCR